MEQNIYMNKEVIMFGYRGVWFVVLDFTICFRSQQDAVHRASAHPAIHVSWLPRYA